MTGALHAEWTKARTVPSTGWLLLVVVLAMVGLGLAVTGTLRIDECTKEPCAFDTVKLSLAGVRLAQVGAAILGVLLVTGDYATGTITPTLAGVPRRWAVLVSKVAVGGALVAGAAVVGVVGAMLTARAVLPGRGLTAAAGYPQTTVLHDLTQRAAVGTVLYLVLVALLGTGIGLLVRDTGAAVAVVLALLLAVPLVAMFVSDADWQARIHRFAPMDAGLAIQSTRDLATLPIGPWPGLALLAAYALAAAMAGGIVLRLRDATRLPS
jgi:ABC-2 type transport system permease protein